MSHARERAEKICLNCNTELTGRYCHNCGQENIEPKETVWGLISHFFADITHFDGKFFSTSRYLITKPGFLPKEYIKGRRASYLHPIRMYVFSSALFFLVFYAMFDLKDSNFGSKREALTDSASSLQQAKKVALADADTREDSMNIERAFAFGKNIPGVEMKVDSTEKADSAELKKKKKKRNPVNYTMASSRFPTVEAYDSAQKALPAAERDNWFERTTAIKTIQINNKYKDRENEFWQDTLNKFMHTFPYLLFVSLPLYAIFLKLLYVRRRQFYYADHGLFLIYLYIFTFIFLLIFFSIIKIEALVDSWSLVFGLLKAALVIYGIYYAYKAMRVFYAQGRFKTILKFLTLNFLAFVSLMILFTLFFVFVLYRI